MGSLLVGGICHRDSNLDSGRGRPHQLGLLQGMEGGNSAKVTAIATLPPTAPDFYGTAAMVTTNDYHNRYFPELFFFTVGG